MGQVLVLEDEALVAMLLEDLLLDFGFEPRLYGNSGDALLALAENQFELAILDVNLGASLSYPVADALLMRGIPFAFATGYGRAGVDPKYASVPVLHKPFDGERLRSVLGAAGRPL